MSTVTIHDTLSLISTLSSIGSTLVVHDLVARAEATTTAALDDPLHEEIKCYNLPYGILGFVSHVLTYYTILCLYYGRKPLWPFSRVKFSRYDLALGGIGLLVSSLLSIVTIIRCKDTWQLLVVGVWKMSMSLLNGVTAVHVALLVILKKRKLKKEIRKRVARVGSEESGVTVVADAEGVQPGEPERESERKDKAEVKEKEKGKEEKLKVVVDPLRIVAWWLILYIPGMFAGIVGMMSLVIKHYSIPGIQKLTAGFYTTVGAGTLVVALVVAYRVRGKPNKERVKRVLLGGLLWLVGSFSVLAIFYSDWALGMMTANLDGLPSGDNSALYWAYFVAKRLPMFSL